MDKIINLTEHNVNICDDLGNIYETIEPSGMLLRVPTTDVELVKTVCGVPLVRPKYGKVKGLPSQRQGTYYIVSKFLRDKLLQQYPGRSDFVVPEGLIRNSDGAIVGCKALSLE